MIKIKGKYSSDNNFTTVFSGDKIYTIARKTGDWGCLSVGSRAYIGGVLTKEQYEKMESECSEEGTFILKE